MGIENALNAQDEQKAQTAYRPWIRNVWILLLSQLERGLVFVLVGYHIIAQIIITDNSLFPVKIVPCDLFMGMGHRRIQRMGHRRIQGK